MIVFLEITNMVLYFSLITEHFGVKRCQNSFQCRHKPIKLISNLFKQSFSNALNLNDYTILCKHSDGRKIVMLLSCST